MGLNYVDIVTKGYEGWLNLFIDEYIITVVSNGYLADKIRAEVPERGSIRNTEEHDEIQGVLF